jgi:hypothetical protein
MARARNIKPGFFKNEKLAKVDPLGRILFSGLWTLADREGRLEDRPERIKIELLPYDKVSVEKLLKELAALGFILQYTVGEGHYIQIVKWKEHQHPHVKELASTIPAPDLPDQARDKTGSNPSLALTLNPITDSLKPKDDVPSDGIIAEIACAHPKNSRKKLKPHEVPQAQAVAVIDAIGEESQQQGVSNQVAAEWILAKTRHVAKITAETGKVDFVLEPTRFFREREYRREFGKPEVTETEMQNARELI